MLSSNLPSNSWITLLTSLKGSQNTHQCPCVCAPKQGNPIVPPRKHPLQLTMTKTPTNIYSCCLSRNCLFETTIFHGKDLAATNFFGAFNTCTHQDFPRIRNEKNSF